MTVGKESLFQFIKARNLNNLVLNNTNYKYKF